MGWWTKAQLDSVALYKEAGVLEWLGRMTSKPVNRALISALISSGLIHQFISSIQAADTQQQRDAIVEEFQSTQPANQSTSKPSTQPYVVDSPLVGPYEGDDKVVNPSKSKKTDVKKQPSGKIDMSKTEGLRPELRSKVENILRGLVARGWHPRVAEGIRTIEQQREKVRKGYSKTMNSKHLKGLAADIIDRRWGWEGPTSNTNHQFWKDLGELAKKEGLIWGGDWTSLVDVAHVQLGK